MCRGRSGIDVRRFYWRILTCIPSLVGPFTGVLRIENLSSNQLQVRKSILRQVLFLQYPGQASQLRHIDIAVPQESAREQSLLCSGLEETGCR